MRTRGRLAVSLAAFFLLAACPAVFAEEAEISATLVPARLLSVKGDKEKFEEQHWQKAGYAGGLKNLSIKSTLPDGVHFTMDSHAIIDQNDLGTKIGIEKENLGFLRFNYDEFTKYYDGTGGVYKFFTVFDPVELDRKLALDIGHFGVETGLKIEGLPELEFYYDREFKDGAKSRLSWTAVKEGSVTRKIGPAWQEIDEIVDSFGLKAQHEVAGFSLKGEQRFEFVRSENLREERNFSTSGLAADNFVIRQDQAPQSDLASTFVGAERNYFDNKLFTSTGYRYLRLRGREWETTITSNGTTGQPFNFSNPEQKRDARADSIYDSHTWTGNITTQLADSLSFITKLKSEVLKRRSNSTYPADNLPANSTPNGVIDENDQSLTDTKAARWGEGFGFRWSGLPRTALYTDLELEQVRQLLREDRKDVIGNAAGELFSRETVAEMRRGAWTLGGHSAPWQFLDFTAHVRRRLNAVDYDDQRETTPTSTAKSAFFDGQSIHTNEFAGKATLKPCRWFRTAFRYQLREDNYFSRAESEPVVKTDVLSNTYTYDVVIQPLSLLMTTLSFSRQTLNVSTPAALASTANTPDYNANVNTWLIATDFTPTAKLALNGQIQYSKADNFNDFTTSGLPLGENSKSVDLTLGVKYAFSEDLSAGVEYDYYHYLASSIAEAGNYSANELSIEISKKF